MKNLVFIGSGMDGILWTTGSLVYSPTTNNLGELLAGPDGYVLKMTGGIPTWTSPVDTNLGNTDLISNANIRTYTLFGSTPSEKLSFLNGDSLSILTLKGDRTIAFDGYTTNGFVKTGSGNGTLIISQQVDSTEGGTGRSSWTANALPYISATNTFNEILAGTNGHVLTMVAGTPAWATPPTDTNIYNTSSTITTATRTVTLAGNTSSDYLDFLNNSSQSALRIRGDRELLFGGYTTNGFVKTSAGTGLITVSTQVSATEGGTGRSSWTANALPYISATNTFGEILAGTNGNVLTMVAGVPSWAAVSAPNLGSANLTSTDDARTFTLKSGGTASQNFQILNSGGGNLLKLSGNKAIDFGSGTNTINPKFYLDGDVYQYFSLYNKTNANSICDIFATASYANGVFYLKNAAGNTKISMNAGVGGVYTETAIITLAGPYSSYRLSNSIGNNIAELKSGNTDNGEFYLCNSSGTYKVQIGVGGSIIDTNLKVGGSFASATAALQIVGPGSTSATTTALFQNSSAVTSLELKDDLSVNIGTSGTGSTTNFYLPTGNAGMNIYSLSGVKMLAVSSNSRRFNFLTPNQSTALEVNVNADVSPFMRVQNDGWQLIYKPSSGAYEAMNLSMAGAYPYLNMRDAVNSSTVNIVGGNSSNFLYSMTIGSMAATNASCLLELVSTTKGFGLPSMTTAQKNAISTPIAGLVVYDSSLTSPYYYNGSAWSSFSGISGTTNYVARYTGTTTLGTGIIQDNGSRVGINSSPQSNYKVYIDSDEIVGLQVVNNAPSGSNNFGLAGSATNSNTASNVGVFGNALLSSGGTNLGVRGQSASQAITASNSIVAAGSNIGGFFQANESSGTAYGLVSSADSTSNQASATFIGALIRADNAGTKYAVQLIDGTESAGKFLKSITSDGKANWANITYSDITNSTSLAIGVGSIELGNASDTTISRSSSGVIAVEGVVIPSVSSTNTLTNKRITQRTGSTTSSATPTINTDNVDFYELTAQAVDITSFTTNLSGTPTKAQKLWISITGTAARAITWGASFEASTIALPTTTVSTNRLDVGFIWNDVTNKWRCVGSV